MVYIMFAIIHFLDVISVSNTKGDIFLLVIFHMWDLEPWRYIESLPICFLTKKNILAGKDSENIYFEVWGLRYTLPCLLLYTNDMCSHLISSGIILYVIGGYGTVHPTGIHYQSFSDRKPCQ